MQSAILLPNAYFRIVARESKFDFIRSCGILIWETLDQSGCILFCRTTSTSRHLKYTRDFLSHVKQPVHVENSSCSFSVAFSLVTTKILSCIFIYFRKISSFVTTVPFFLQLFIMGLFTVPQLSSTVLLSLESFGVFLQPKKFISSNQSQSSDYATPIHQYYFQSDKISVG